MNPNPPILAFAFAALIALPLSAGEVKEKAAGKPAAPASEAAMKIHVDPATGQVVSKPAPGTRTALAPAPAAERAPLKVEKGTTKAGGKRVRLDDRFMMEMTLGVAPDGKVSQGCAAEHEKTAAAVTPAKEDRHDR